MRLLYICSIKYSNIQVIIVLKVAAITNHELAATNYWDQLEQIAASDVDFIVLREKRFLKMTTRTMPNGHFASAAFTKRRVSFNILAKSPFDFTFLVSNAPCHTLKVTLPYCII